MANQILQNLMAFQELKHEQTRIQVTKDLFQYITLMGSFCVQIQL